MDIKDFEYKFHVARLGGSPAYVSVTGTNLHILADGFDYNPKTDTLRLKRDGKVISTSNLNDISDVVGIGD